MAEFNINKRIDSLGRIVIPKEVRKKLKIVDGENLELSIENDKIIVKKCSTSALDKKVISIVLSLMLEHIDESIIIFDVTGNCYSKKNEIIKLDFLEDFINGKLTEATLNKRFILPIHVDGVLYGGIVLNSELKEIDKLRLLGILKTVIEKYLEA